MSKPERLRNYRTFGRDVACVAAGVAMENVSLILTDGRDELAAVIPAAEYRRLQALDVARQGPAV